MNSARASQIGPFSRSAAFGRSHNSTPALGETGVRANSLSATMASGAH